MTLLRPLLALCLIRNREFDEASSLLDEVLAQKEIKEEVRRELLFWKGVCHLQAAEVAKAQETFGRYYQESPPSDPRRYEAAILFGTGYILQEQHEEAIAFFKERAEKLGERQPEIRARMLTRRLHSLLETNQLGEALSLVLAASKEFDSFVQIIGLQSLILNLGSRLLDDERYYEAISCLQQVWQKERLLGFQQERQQRLEKKIRVLKARGNADALVFQLEGLLTRIVRELEHFRKITEYDAALRMRLAKAYLGLQRYREAALIIEGMLGKMETSPIVESASVTLVHCWSQIARWHQAIEGADVYLERFGYESKSAPTIVFLKGQAAQSGKAYDVALEAFSQVIDRYPKSVMAANAFFMRGICHLQKEDYDQAIAVFKSVPIAYPKHAKLAESALYWQAMGESFAGNHTQCLALVQRHFKEYPDDYYKVDARFREAFAFHSLSDYTLAIAHFESFIGQHGDSSYVNEARLLLGDALLAVGELDRGIAAYATIDPESIRFHEDGLFKTAKAMRLSERYQDLKDHLDKFVADHPNSARLAEAVYWLGWNEQRQGKLEEARDLYWRMIREHGNDPKITSMEDLVDGMLKLYSGREERARLAQEWERQAERAIASDRNTLALRALWGQAKALVSQTPVQSVALLLRATPLIEPQKHHPRILIDCAKAQLEMGEPEVAEDLYQSIAKWNPSAFERDLAEDGLGHAALDRGHYEKALEHFQRVARRDTGVVPPGPLLLAVASCHEALNDRQESIATLDALLAKKKTKSAYKSKALVQSGDLLARAGEKAKALVYFERVYVVYGKFLPEVAQAYLKRAILLEELGEPDKAHETYTEMMQREDLKSQPEYALARQRLEKLLTPNEPIPTS